MTPEERKNHVDRLRRVERLASNIDLIEALTAAISALEREGQMEARLRWIAENSGIEGFSHIDNDVYAYTADVQMENGTLDNEATGDERFAGFCRMVDKAMEASDG